MNFRVACCLLVAGVAGLVGRAATIEEIVDRSDLWPVEVKVVSAAKAVMIENGMERGAMLIGSGKQLRVSALVPEGVIGKIGGVTVRVPFAKTDLAERVAGVTAGPPAASTPVIVPAETEATPVTATAAKPAGAKAPSIMQRRLAGKLVRLQSDKLVAADAASLAGVKYYALYFSASWCGPCKAFTPDLVAEYKKLKAKYPEFEVVFVSADRSAGAMRDYMREDRMPWPALNYEARDGSAELMRYGGPGIPCLVLVDAGGVVLSDSFEGDNYVGPQKVLADATKLLKRGG